MEYTKYYIGNAFDSNIRFKASSGGVGSILIKYLLENQLYGTTITFIYDTVLCQYVPKFVHCFDDVNICGSVYQDIDLYTFIKNNIDSIKGGIVVTCCPCQVSPIRSLLKKFSIPNFLISFSCSGQTTIEGTWTYYKYLGIDKNDVLRIQYRGNGWPSGIQIWLKDGRYYFHKNYTEPWSIIHQSALFRPKRCFFCKFDTSRKSDISLADPWLESYISTEKIGKSFVLINTQDGNQIISQLVKENFLELEDSSYEEYSIAQKPNVDKAQMIKRKMKFFKLYSKLNDSSAYVHFFSKNITLLKFHNMFRRIMIRLC